MCGGSNPAHILILPGLFPDPAGLSKHIEELLLKLQCGFFFKLKVRKGGLQLFERKRQCSFNPDPLNPENWHVRAALGLLWALLNDALVFL